MVTNEDVNGPVEVTDGETYWMGNKVNKCPDCGVAPTNVDDCGHFGDPDCPYFGVGLENMPRQALAKATGGEG